MSNGNTHFEQRIAFSRSPLPDADLDISRADDWGVQGDLGLTWQMMWRPRLDAVCRTEAPRGSPPDDEIRIVQPEGLWHLSTEVLGNLLRR